MDANGIQHGTPSRTPEIDSPGIFSLRAILGDGSTLSLGIIPADSRRQARRVARSWASERCARRGLRVVKILVEQV